MFLIDNHSLYSANLIDNYYQSFTTYRVVGLRLLQAGNDRARLLSGLIQRVRAGLSSTERHDVYLTPKLSGTPHGEHRIIQARILTRLHENGYVHTCPLQRLVRQH